jgi:DNA-binding NarL/FixJ family response regulator
MRKVKVFIVDDHAIMRDGIRALLSVNDDIQVVGEASEGKEAIIKIPELKPDVVIMDIAMPGMDGMEATRQIVKANAKVKVLILTQHDNKDYVLSAIKAGASGFVPKRAVSSELVSAILTVYRGGSALYPSVASALIEDYRHRTELEPYDRLTTREREVLRLIAEGHTSQEIANMLIVSIKTILGHRSKIMEKLDIHNRTDLIKYAMRKGLINIDQ